MIVVPDAGPLIYLGGAGKLELLVRLYDRVVVPLAVYREIVVAGAGLVGAAEVSAAGWLDIQDAPIDPTLSGILDRGEAAAIPLAQRLGATLLCDDAPARAEARRRGIPLIGTLGVLRLAKERGHLERIRPVIEKMQTMGMYASDVLLREILVAVAEDDEPT